MPFPVGCLPDVASVRGKRLCAESYEPTAGFGPPFIAASGSTSEERVGNGLRFVVPDFGGIRLIRED